ncbi:DUF952 domain-containing protein [Sphaerothrix gracilis]|uniref:DUF952 domain-containing protein n=1 Tax=Sphaerothrix gracilis TaxID=3151835 RepID=UPI003D15F4DB
MIYHITTAQRWHSSKGQNHYAAEFFGAEGFIHCSNADQVVRVANHLFRNTGGLILLHIQTERLHPRLVYENLEGGEELFPHVYGPINLDAVVCISPFEPGLDGYFNQYEGSFESVYGS